MTLGTSFWGRESADIFKMSGDNVFYFIDN